MFAENLPESVIKRLSIRVKEAGGINLGQGIPSFPTPGHILDAARLALADPAIGAYPNFLGSLSLRQAVIDRLNSEYGLTLSAADNVLITVGAMEATATAVLSLVGNGDRVGVLTPDYCNHFPQVMLARGEIVEIPMREDDSAWHIDTDKLTKAAEKGLRLLILTNPNNPTGQVFTRDGLKDLVSIASRYGIWILSDETYSFLNYGEIPAGLLSFYQEYERLIVVRSFSKEYAMTGWRVGYAVAPREMLLTMAKTHDALVGCVPKISQRAALAALNGPQEAVQEFVEVFTRRQRKTVSALKKLPKSISFVPPGGAYYIFPKYRLPLTSMAISDTILREVGVAVVPGIVFGSAGEHHIRISFAADDRVLEEGLRRLTRFFRHAARGL
ncbi:hypothetical protein A2Z33_00510 [Candidatus Gottesmanbacteria bacterium RBG_16_52_11]|uniref:Aminotransferase n=1 Tax=Candidatus Gottesmanbacteria bacterium RBG_16_52_11 TaxID=1798374 RepID=A0A1F5YMZ6_9BACT|nr:MAG: hypothetical protein A2Z33_00510 [Candidatus Gottesmanbacteria bacterium RBG_16_52_11]